MFMIPFTFVDKYNRKYKVGVTLPNIESGKNDLTPDNFAFLGYAMYSPKKYYLLVPGNQNSSDNLTVTTVSKLQDYYSATLDTGKRVKIIRFEEFIELDENNEIMYPFRSVRVSFRPERELFCNENTAINSVWLPIYAIEQGSLIERIKELENVDIRPVVKLYKEKEPKFSSIPAKYLETYISAYKNIPEFRKCVENGVGEIKYWIKYSFATIKNKSKEMLKLFDNKETLPTYVKSNIDKNNKRDGEKNILELYNLGFKEDDFSLYTKLIGSFANTYVRRFTDLYNFVNDNNKESPKYSVSEVLKMTGKNKTASRKFFTQFNSIQSNLSFYNKYSLLDITELENMIKSSIINGTFVENADAIRTEIENFDKKSDEYSLRQYPELTVPNDFFDFDFDIYRIKDIKDIKSNQEKEMWDKFHPFFCKLKEGEIALFIKKDNEHFLGIANLINQKFDLYCLHSHPYYNNIILAKIVDANKPCGYFSEHLDNHFIEKIQSCLSKYFYESFVKIRLKSLLSA